MKNAISVAMTTCNGEKYVRAQLDSILAQSLAPAEIIVCDDGSTDNTLPILAAYEKQGLIYLHRNNTRLGVLRNFKKAVSLCNLQHDIALSDQDDIWLPEKLEQSSASLSAIKVDEKPCLVYSDLMLVDDGLNLISPSFWQILNIDPDKEGLRSLLFGNFITGCTILMNPSMRQCFTDMPEDGVSMHDHWIGLIAYTFGAAGAIAGKLVQYRQHGSNVTFETNQKASIKEWIAKNLHQIKSNDQYLAAEIMMAEKFYSTYYHHLSDEQDVVFKSFLRLKQAGYLRKKAAALASRAYRLKGS